LAYSTNTANFAHGPTGLDSQETNAGAIDAWSQAPAPGGAWSDSEKTINDPCPSGYRMPTESQWEGVMENNVQTATGTWSNNVTNYTSARLFGDELMLPATGTRNHSDGALYFRGVRGNYWSSTQSTSDNAEFLSFDSFSAETDSNYKAYGYSVRCITEPPTLGTDQVTLQPGESETVNISGGTGNYTSVTSSNGDVASATLGTNTITITGVSRGTVAITVEDSGGSIAFLTAMIDTSPYSCGAYVAPDVWKEFDCYNLAAIGKTVYDDPFTPSWRLIGGYWRWGTKGTDPGQWYNTNTEHFAHGPTSPYVEGANDGSISGWMSTNYAPNGAWSDTEKTSNDPCPPGFRVPTISQWEGVVENNIQIAVGTWDSDDTNYSSARFFGNDLMLPAAGYRYSGSGELSNRGEYGIYWSSSESIIYSTSAWYLFFDNNVKTIEYYRRNGLSVRCIAEPSCGAYVAPGVWKEFDCYNLAAIGKTTNDDPFTPSWRLIGGYWQWGRKGPDPNQEDWYNTNTEHFAHGPTGPGETEANEGEISTWDEDYAPNGAWSDSEKTANDPCPAGFRVPTVSQWEGVLGNNTQSTVGTWDTDDTNYSSARFFGNDLMLPAAGYRYNASGALGGRGDGFFGTGGYWSSSEGGSSYTWYLHFSGSSAYTYSFSRRHGRSVRCVPE